jgi:HD-like signal output (HDOD) protein/ActR/RegA family two-component response regulator
LTKRILFVDDEPNLLMGLQRTLRPMRNEWEMEFVSSGEEALHSMERHPFDIVVTDMRMPGMTGLELLEKVQRESPQTIRMILSGQSDRSAVVRASGSAHQFLSKPCEPERLRSLLTRTIALTDLLRSASLKKFVSQLKSIPSLPAIYHEITAELRSNDPSPARIGHLIAKDMGMTAKVLQMVNSAVYGAYMEVSDPGQAVLMLGLETIQAIVLSLSIFSAFDRRTLSPQEAERLWDHSVTTSRFSRCIARAEGISGNALDPYQSAGLLHDVGKLVIATADPKAYRKIAQEALVPGTKPWQIEKELLGCSHAEIGAYLLGIWGLPSSIVEAVAWHHHPSESPVNEFSPLAAVHVASVFHAQMHPELQFREPDLDEAFLERLGLAAREAAWLKACSEQPTVGGPR